MLIKEIEGKLNRSCILSIYYDSPLFKLAESHNWTLPVYIYEQDGKTILQAFVSEEIYNRIDVRELRNEQGGSTEFGYHVFEERINHLQRVNIISKLSRMPGVISNGSYITASTLKFEFRFHSSLTGDVSALLSEFMEGHEKNGIEYLGPSPGIRSVLNRLNQTIPLHLVSYSIPANVLNPNELEVVDKYSLVTELQNLRLDEGGKFKVLIYSTRDLPKQDTLTLDTISPEDRIYCYTIKNELLAEIRKRTNELHIPRFSVYMRKFSNRILVTSFLPSSTSDEYVRQIFQVSREFKDTRVTVDAYSDYVETVWDWI